MVDYSKHIDDLDKRMSIIGYIFTSGGCAISSKAILPTTIALSIRAEYIAMSEVVKEANWFRGVVDELSEYLKLMIVHFDSWKLRCSITY